MPSFPQKRESKLVRTETYRIKRFLRFHVLDSRLRGNDGRTVSVFSDKFLRH
ncbi:pilus assembly protein PilS [Neisseria meningitidis]|nr:pilus assembly protein PilS [Neisseria meningitidis]QEN66690.1 pilus assembly protein PilS [Neisseria meningitidis]QEN70993.1 pilus assembly protein PilS [Neisseria meningitidis]QEN73137.1 pilus assembly protein PilS [Neisseria meningitidis]QEN76019.1 pilus assembly protein PilS [Neisseria meningitidis]